MKIIISGFLLIISTLILTGCSGTRDVESLYSNKKITIDGRQSDWDHLASIKDKNIAFGFQNDEHNLYLCMVTNNRSDIMKIIRGGLKIWLEPENSDKIGILYPEKSEPSEMQFGQNNQPPRMESPENQGTQMRDREEMDLKMFSSISNQKELRIVNDDGKILKSYPIDGKTFEAKISFDKGNLCYEAKIPIGGSAGIPYGLKTSEGDKVNVEFISGDISSAPGKGGRPDMGEEGGMHPSGPPPGGGGGFSDGGPGGPGGGPGGMPNFSRNKMDTSPIDFSFDVTLHK